MPKRKTQAGEDLDSDQSVPLPIQTWFWSKTCPFIRPKLGKLCEASCVSFERVVVQNILHGQPPNLCEAIQNISRWKLIQVAMPHVSHSCAALLENRRQNHPASKFSNNETKLLYTLHWIILDAASECEDTATIHDSKNTTPSVHLHPLKSVQLFVYLFAPLVNTLEDSDFQSLKLENGLRLWQPLWDYQQPDIPCFSTPVKPQRNVLKAQRSLLKVNTNAANIYIGKGTSRENLNYAFQFDEESIKSTSESEASPTRVCPLARLSDSELCFMSQSETQSIFSMCEYCNNIKTGRANEGPVVCKCGRKDSYVDIGPEYKQMLQDMFGSIDRDFAKNRLASAVTSGVKGTTSVDVFSASYFDVAVLQCLFCLQWSEEGIHWALKYIHGRLLEICDEYRHMDFKERERSRSLPFSDPNLLRSNSIPPSLFKPKETTNVEEVKSGLGSQQRHTKFASMSPGLSTIPSDSEPPSPAPFLSGFRREPPFKKLCMVELKHYPDSTRAYVRKKEPRGDVSPTSVPFRTKLDKYSQQTLKKDSMGLYHWESKNRPSRSSVDIINKKPAETDRPVKPSLSWAADTGNQYGNRFEFPPSPDQDSEISSQHSSNDSSSWSQGGGDSRGFNSTGGKYGITKPIITITQETPQKSFRNWQQMYDVSKSDGDSLDVSSDGTQSAPGLARSMTDSNICYQQEEEVHEVAGAVHYIQKNGHLNYKVLLQAVHFVSKNHESEKICEVLLNIVNCLLDLDIIEQQSDTEPPNNCDDNAEEQSMTDSGKSEMAAYDLAMDSLISIYKAVGCPQGCGDGLRGRHGDMLRQKGHNCLQRLQKMNPPMFRQYLREWLKSRPIQEIVDFFHAFLGFCVDPVLLLQHQQTHRKSVSQEALQNNGFSNNFGHSIGGVGYRGVEGVFISNAMKTFVSRCTESTKEIYSSDNISLFCDVRQLVTYFKEIHGGTFRRVALSGLLDSYFDVKQKTGEVKEVVTPSSHPISRTTSVTSESGDEKEGQKAHTPNSSASEGKKTKSRKSIFRKRMKKQLNLQQPYAASDSELVDEIYNKNSPRASLSAAEDDPPSGTSTPKRKFSKFHIGWRKPKSDHEEDSPGEPGILDRRESKSEAHFHGTRLKGKMSFKTASQATLTFLSARRRIEGGLKQLGKKMSKQDITKDIKQNHNEPAEDPDVEVIVREKKMVDKYIIKSGMLRFNFLLECCHPGTVPDPQLVAAMLQLDAPVSARATLLLECAHFVHRCSHDDWPNWMRLNLPSFRHSSSALGSRGQPSGFRRTLTLQKAAGRMFYSWAENLGHQMEFIMAKERQNKLKHITDIHDEKKKRQLRMDDDEEDFLDENTVNQSGNECPYALKMLACLVLQEITTFMRERFQHLPRTKKQKNETGWDKSVMSRRYSSIVSSPGHSDKSSDGEMPHSPGAGAMGSPGDRKISFAVNADRPDSLNSSQNSLPALDPGGPPHTPVEERKGRRLAQGRQKLLKHLRRGSTHNASLRQNRSFRMRRQEGGGSIKMYGSIRSRKVSSQSIQSDGAKFVDGDPNVDDYESMTMFSEEAQEAATEEQQDVEDEKLYQNMPWIKVVIQLANLSNFICPHQGFCHPDCYERQRRSCSRLVAATKKIYESTAEEQQKESEKKLEQKRDMLKERFKRRESIFQQSSPTKRRESTPLLEKIKTDVSLVKQKLNNWKKGDKPKEAKEDSAIVKYISSQAQKLIQCPLGILSKAAPILTEDNFIDIMPVAWELMTESDQELSAAAACMFLISSVKAPEKAQTMVFKELQHEDPQQRTNAVLRFGTLWKFRHQVWPRMEEGAQMHFKLPPPGIDFTLPSPTIGLPSQVPIDPPWQPHFKAKIEEVTVNQDQTKSLVTATTTRRKQQQEMIRRALQREEERKKIGRETFPLTTVSVTQLAALEPSLHHVSEDHEEAMQEEISLAARRVSLAPTNRNNVSSRSMSWRNGSMHWARLTTFEGDEERQEHLHHVQLAQTFFPSSICAVVLPIIHLLDDGEVSDNGVAVSEVAEKVIWNCVVEDPNLFLRHFLEKMTHKDKHEELLFLLRKMSIYYRELPWQMAHSLFNYLIGYIMFYVRTPQSYGQEAIASALALLWQIVPSVEGIYFKDLKQTLKKEQCDPHIMISANIPSAKKIIVHGPDLTSIPSQFPIHEDTQFNVILQDSLEFFNIPDEQQNSYFLVDTKSNQIHNLNSYVRDFYFFRRNFYPQLSLVHMDPEEAQENLQKQAFLLKFVEIGKVLFSVKILDSTAPHQVQNHVSFLHEELVKLPSFPRKALDADFSLYSGSLGKEIYGLDTLHKLSWLKLMHTMFTSMTSSFNWNQDLGLFLNVINGCIILHCEDTAILRYSFAVIMNTSIHFKHIFSQNGFLYVMPTLLRTYSNHQPNPVVCGAIQYVCRQFYILHRKPFILQMFGSVASILDTESATTGLNDTTKVQPDCLFKLLMSLDHDSPDPISILELVDGEKPFKALDFCYENDPDSFNILDVVNLCVTVVMYSPDSFRSVQMMNILEVVLPRYLEYLKSETDKRDNRTAARAEIVTLGHISTSIKALVTSCEIFTRSMYVPVKQLESDKAGGKDKNRGSPVETSVFYDEREDSCAGRHMEEGRGRKSQYYDQEDEYLQMRDEFRRPRDSLLNIVAEFFSTGHARLKELRKMLADPSYRPPELLDHKTHNRLAEIAHTLLKLAPYDAETMACAGLQRYMTEILPITDWSQEPVRPALNLILRRLDRLFNKISKKNYPRRKCDWEAAANLLKGVYLTLKKFQYIAHLPHLKTVINILITIVLSSGSQTIMESLPGMGVFRSEHGSTIIPPAFCSEVVKLVAMQMQALGYTGYYAWVQPELMAQQNLEHFSLEQICGGTAFFPTSERCINMLVNFILPLCIRVGCGRRDTPKLRQMDINYALTVILNVLDPPAKTSSASQNNSAKSAMHHLSISEHGRCSSFSHAHKGSFRYQGNELLIQVAYLGLKILMTCFDKPLSPEWHRVAKCIINNSVHKTCLPLWKFLDFVVTHRPSIFLMIQPFIQFRMMKVNCDTAQEYYIQQTIKDKLQGYSFTHPKCGGAVLIELALELKQVKDDFIATGGEYRSRSATMATDRSDFSQAHVNETRLKSSVTEITAEIIGVPKPTLATLGKRASKATILSQGSSNTSGVPFKATVLTSSFDSCSPQSSRKTCRRISAHDGTKILEKFRKPTLEDVSPSDQLLESPTRLHRQPTFVLKTPLSNQNSIDEQPPAEVIYENEVAVSREGQDLNPHEHRLQRQDAKSRKTFKMKRTKTKPTSMRRFVARRGPNNQSDSESNSTDGSPTHGSGSSNNKKHGTDDESLQLQRTGTGQHVPSGSPRQESFMARSVETISQLKDEHKKSKPRYIQRSKSHDDPHGDIHAPAGTARGRIARQGARIVRSRSPSSSPVRGHKSPHGSPIKRLGQGDKGGKTSGAVEMSINVTQIPGAGSPPQSAQSVKESKSHFRFSLRKKDRRHASRPESPIEKPSGCESPDLFSPPGYDKPKPLLTSPVKKPSSPLSLVKARINQFAMKDSSEAIKSPPPQGNSMSVIKPLPPPPVPPRTFKPPLIPSPHPLDQPSPAESESSIHSPKPIGMGLYGIDTTDKQSAGGKPYKTNMVASPNSHDHFSPMGTGNHGLDPVERQTAGTQYPGSKYKITRPIGNNSYTRMTNPFMSSPETPTEDLTDSFRVEDSKSTTQTYVSSRCSSDESLTEATSLLKDEEKTRSRSSVCIYFDGSDIPDTLV